MWRAAAATAACGLVFLGSTAAHAAPPRTAVESVSVSSEGLDVRIRGVDLPEGVELDPAAVTVRLDGREVPATAELAPVQPGSGVRKVMLVLDTSGSMAGARMPAALAAIRTYLEEVPADVQIGLVTFAQDVAVAVPLTPDRALLRAELDRVRPDGATSLYDAVLAAKDALGTEGERRLLVLSDGEDTDSAQTLEAVLGGLSGIDVPVDAVVLGDEPAAAAVLQQVADRTLGRLLLAADATEATTAFASAAKAFGTRLLVRVPVPEDLAGRPAALEVLASTSTGMVSSSPVPVELPAAPVMTAPVRPVPPSGIGLVVGLVVLFAGLAGALCLAVSSGDTVAMRRKRTHTVLDSYDLSQLRERVPIRGEPQSRLGDGAVVRTAVELAGRAVKSRGIEERLALRLDRAGLRFTASEWVVVQMTAATVAAALTFVLSGTVLVALATAVLAGLAVHLTLHIKAKRRAAAFLAGMPDALQLVASSLSSGYSLSQALDAAVREGEDPIATEFGRALAEARIGVPLEQALDGVAERMDSRDFSWVVMAVRIQREVGGNLSEVLETLCRTLRDRQALRRQVAALSAEGRLSAYILIGLPIALGAWFSFSRPEYFGVMYTSIWGWAMLAGSAVALTLGGLWMQKLVKVEM